jgi:hypothetical protein
LHGKHQQDGRHGEQQVAEEVDLGDGRHGAVPVAALVGPEGVDA